MNTEKEKENTINLKLASFLAIPLAFIINFFLETTIKRIILYVFDNIEKKISKKPESKENKNGDKAN
jgi:hypothetical protein